MEPTTAYSVAENAARRAASAFLNTIDTTRFLKAAATAPNSAVFILYQDGPHVLEFLGASSPTGPDEAHVSGPTEVPQPNKYAYMPIALIEEALGVEIGTFTYSKQRDIPVVVALCQLDNTGARDEESMFHATFVYSQSASAPV
jgi:hypothetical protein